MDPSTFASAYALSMSAGVRPFVTLALASLAVHFGWIHLAHAYAGLGTDGATAVLMLLAAIELLADKVPGIDHALHVLHFATKPVAAALIVGSALPSDLPTALIATAAGFGALNAVGVHTGMAAIRGGSSTLTLGMANPVVSFLEDVATAVVFVLAFILPFVGACLALGVTLGIAGLAYLALRTLSGRGTPGAPAYARTAEAGVIRRLPR